VHDLGVMAAEIIVAAGRRAGSKPPVAEELWQFDRHGHGVWSTRPVPTEERPPANSLRAPPC
jgi:hypothetical protein